MRDTQKNVHNCFFHFAGFLFFFYNFATTFFFFLQFDFFETFKLMFFYFLILFDRFSLVNEFHSNSKLKTGWIYINKNKIIFIHVFALKYCLMNQIYIYTSGTSSQFSTFRNHNAVNRTF